MTIMILNNIKCKLPRSKLTGHCPWTFRIRDHWRVYGRPGGNVHRRIV